MSQDIKEVTTASNSTAIALYTQLREAEKNLFFSPISISTALSMVYAGARGATAEEMKEALGFTMHWRRLPIAYETVIKELGEIGIKSSSKLSIANALWLQAGYDLLENFVYIMETHYKGGMKEVDFSKGDEAVEQINQWVKEKTEGKIPEILEKSEDRSGTKLILTNAIYFLGQWKEPFTKDNTKDQPFYLISGKEELVPMMYQKREFPHMEQKNSAILILDYQDQRLAMVVILPKTKGGIAEVEKTINAKTIDHIIKHSSSKEVKVFLPKFKFEFSAELSKQLKKLGMVSAFREEADFSGMTNSGGLVIKKVIHKAFVEVNEEGTEAAAATVVEMALKAAMIPQKTTVFKADHPFIFLIYDKKTETILFMGRVMNPKNKD